MASKGRAEVLSSVYKYKAVMYVIEKIYVLDKFHSGMSCSAVGHEFNLMNQ